MNLRSIKRYTEIIAFPKDLNIVQIVFLTYFETFMFLQFTDLTLNHFPSLLTMLIINIKKFKLKLRLSEIRFKLHWLLYILDSE